uniref:Ig-like domain-containing protein n=1 Tax=Meloidogyne hapla TaxID=6305 RepID=A0A1I8BPE3_MELHA
MLQIKRTKPEDYGLYKCKVSDEFGETEATVHLAIGTVQIPLPSPPEMPRQCCARRGVSKRCLLMCGMTDSETRRYVPRPFMSQNCSGEIAKVPSQCLYLCDHQQKAPNLMPSQCLDYVATAEQCRLSGIQNRPSVVRSLKAQITTENTLSTSTSVLINYDHSERADIYYIYWRSEGSIWQHRSSTGTNKKLVLASSVDELVVVAANTFGFSQPAQLFLREGKWVKI